MSEVKTDVTEFLQVLGLGSLEPKISDELTELANRVNTTGNKGVLNLQIVLTAHRQEDYLQAATKLTVEKPKSNGTDRDVTNYKDVVKIDNEKEGLVVLSKSELPE